MHATHSYDHQNKWLILLSFLRILKIQPLVKVFNKKQKENLIKWRIISTICLHYVVCHWFACIMIAQAFYDTDWTQNWLRRCPVPQVQGTRTNPDDRSDLSAMSVYVHALYYVMGTVSHVAIGDITGVNHDEFLYNTIFGWVGTFIYCLLFADITSLISEL